MTTPIETASQTKSRRRSFKGPATRERIVQAAFEVIGEHGYQNSSMAEIAARAGVTQGGLLHHFPSKLALLLGVIEQRDVLDQAYFVSDVQPAIGAEILDAYLGLARRNATMMELTRGFTILVSESLLPEHPAQSWAKARYRVARGHVRTALRRGQEAGTVRADVDIDALAVEIVAVMDGLQIQWLLEPEAIDLPAAFEAYCRRIRNTFEISETRP